MIALWIAAAVFAAVVVAKIVRDVARPSDPNNPYDI